MPLAKKVTPAQGNSTLPETLLNQMQNNFSAQEDEIPEPVQETPAAPVHQEEEPKVRKNRYSDAVNISLSQGKRTKFKTFFSKYELNMTSGFEMAVDYIMREVNAGRLTLSKSGIEKAGEADE